MIPLYRKLRALVEPSARSFSRHDMAVYAMALAYRGLLALFPFAIFLAENRNVSFGKRTRLKSREVFLRQACEFPGPRMRLAGLRVAAFPVRPCKLRA